MPADNCFPYLQQGILGAKAAHYSTDGLQFFGLSSKENNAPEALIGNLSDKNLQYEFSYTALQTERFALNGEKDFLFMDISCQIIRTPLQKQNIRIKLKMPFYRLPKQSYASST